MSWVTWAQCFRLRAYVDAHGANDCITKTLADNVGFHAKLISDELRFLAVEYTEPGVHQPFTHVSELYSWLGRHELEEG